MLIPVLVLAALPAGADAAPPLVDDELPSQILGTRRGRIDGLKPQGQRDGLAWFTTAGDVNSFRGNPLEQVRYGFASNRLAQIELYTGELGPSLTFGCEDLPSSQNKLWGALKSSLTFEHSISTLTSSPPDHRIEPLIERCNAAGADHCSEVRGIRAPRGEDPEAQELVVSVRGVQWIRQRTPADLTAAEPINPIDEYRCVFTVVIEAGRSNAELAQDHTSPLPDGVGCGSP